MSTLKPSHKNTAATEDPAPSVEQAPAPAVALEPAASQPTGLRGHAKPDFSRLPRLWAKQLGEASDLIDQMTEEASGAPHQGLDKARLHFAESVISYASVMAELASHEPSRESMQAAVNGMRDLLVKSMRKLDNK